MAPGPRLLLVEDDATSAAFLAEALAGMPARVDVAGNIAQACTLAAAATHALWLVDAHLPDGDGLACLHALREIADAPALAITAGAPRRELDALCAAGYLEVLMKPVSIAVLEATVRRLLGDDTAPPRPASPPRPGFGKLPVWEQERALAAIGGNAGALSKLRSLFLAELPAQREEMRQAQREGDSAAVRALVHKLRAGSGFTGAARLARTLEALHADPLDAQALRDFGCAADDTLGASPQP